MDEIKMNISSKLMKGLVSKLLSKVVYKKLGCEVDIQVNDLTVNMVDGETVANANVTAKLSSKEFTKLIESLS